MSWPLGESIPTVLGDIAVERRRGTVILRGHTEQGRFALRFTPAVAQLAGTQLRLKAVEPVGEKLSEPRGPIEKPGGGLL